MWSVRTDSNLRERIPICASRCDSVDIRIGGRGLQSGLQFKTNFYFLN